MHRPAPHIARQAPRSIALLLCLAVLAGCQSLSNANSSALVRVIDVSPDAPALDIYQGSNAVAYNLNFGTVTSYVPVTPGNSTFTIALAGSRRVLSSVEGTFAAGTLYTMLVNSSVASMQQAILTDRGQTADTKVAVMPSVRLIHQASRMGAVDVYLVPAGQRISSVSPIATNLAPGGTTGYLSIPACTCAAVMLPAGTVPSAGLASHIGTQTNFGSGTARTMILVDPQTPSPRGLQVITVIDADPLN